MSKAAAILFAAVSEKPKCLTVFAKLPTMKQVDFVVDGKKSMGNLISFVAQVDASLGRVGVDILCMQEESKARARVCPNVLVSLADVRAVAVVRDAEGDERFALRLAPIAEIPDLPELGKDLRFCFSHGTTPSGDLQLLLIFHWAETQKETCARVRFHPD
eukprot:jgi/Tetstr1/455824/TSEL_042616.t1